MRFLACSQDAGDPAHGRYIHELTNSLGASLRHARLGSDTETSHRLRAACASQSYDLVLLPRPPASLALVTAALAVSYGAGRITPSLLYTGDQGWPIQSILLLIRGAATDETAVDWTLHLAAQQPGENQPVHVTARVVLPPYSSQTGNQQATLAAALRSDTLSGQHVRQALTRLGSAGGDGRLKLSGGSPEQQITHELAETAYDLIVVGIEPQGRLLQWRLESLVTPLLRWTARPVLLARSPLQIGEQNGEAF